ncbi:MAG: integrase, partial [Thermomicrobiales bacterium]|nr:integrase [Thermomicrobiales bacterium]
MYGLVKLKLAPNTIDGAVRVLNGAYTDAVRLGVAAAYPVTGTRRPSLRQKPVAAWSADEVKRVFEALKDDPMWNAVYWVVLATGMRPGEFHVLRWGDIELEKYIVTIRRSMTKDADGHRV